MEKVKKISISLKEFGYKPKGLYYIGHFEEKILTKCVTVVGSRKMTEYGRQVIRKLVPQLVEFGKVIVSGLMYGVDQTAHRECIDCGGKTVAVLGWGLRWEGVGKREKDLMKEIIDSGGAVISEWKENPSSLWMFPHRDRTMAAMSSDVYVVEGAIKSGSLITAQWGIRFGKKVWAVPGPITSKVSEGTNWLIATGNAEMWLPEQQLRLETENKNEGINTHVSDIYHLLQNEVLCIDEIALKIGRSVESVSAELTMMEVRGEVEERAGKYYIVD